MGSSVSALDVAKSFNSMATTVHTPENIQLFVSSLPSLPEADLNSAVPCGRLREMRHLYTKSFACLLRHCIKVVVNVAERRSNEVLKLSQEEELSFQGSLLMLQRMMPFALESGAVPLDDRELSNVPLAPTRTQGTAEGSSSESTSSAEDEVDETNTEGMTQESEKQKRTLSTSNFIELFFCRDSKCDDAEVDSVFEPLSTQKVSPAGELLMWSLVECCFIPGLTLPEINLPKEPDHSLTHPEVDARLLWQYGVACGDPLTKKRRNPGAKECLHRKLVLNTLQVCLSSQMYHEFGFRDSIFMESLISVDKVPLMPTLSISLLNSICSYEPYGPLLFSNYLSSNKERDVLLASCRLLCTVLCYVGIPLSIQSDLSIDEDNKSTERASSSKSSKDDDPLGKTETDGNETDNMRVAQGEENSGKEDSKDASDDRAKKNRLRAKKELAVKYSKARNPKSVPTFIHSVRKVVADITLTEAKAVLFGYIKLVKLRCSQSQAYLPDAELNLISEDEIMLLLWKLVDLSPQVQFQLANRKDTLLEYIVPIICYASDIRRSMVYVHHLQLVLFTLQKLSEHRGFGIACNTPFKQTVPFPFPKMSADSTYFDFIIIALCLIMELEDQRLNPLYEFCSTVIANMAPFATSISKEASARLVYTFVNATHRNLTRASNVYSEVVMTNTCEAIASILQYHERGSKYLLATLVNYKEIIHSAKEEFHVKQNKTLSFSPAIPFLIAVVDVAVQTSFTTISAEGIHVGTSVNETSNAENREPLGSNGELKMVKNGVENNPAAVKCLESITLVGKLPTPHLILVRGMSRTKAMDQWESVTLWSILYRNLPQGWMGDRFSIKLLNLSPTNLE